MGGLSRNLLAAAREPVVKTDVAVVRRGKTTVKAGRFAATLEWDRTVAADLDGRKLLRAVALELGAHFRDSLLAGVTQDTGAAIPRDSDGTPVGVRSGWMARNWKISPTRGSARACELDLEVNTSDAGPAPPGRKSGTRRAGGRARVVEVLANRRPPVLLQSLDGRSEEVFHRAFGNALAAAWPELRTPSSVPQSGGTLATMGGR